MSNGGKNDAVVDVMWRDWQATARTFHERADEYDGWFEDSAIFANELDALRALGPLPAPACEIGAGPGRFAAALGCGLGIDLARAPLMKARTRGLTPVQARGEFLPFAGGSLGSIALVMTLCFTENPAQVLRECQRVLRSGGLLLLGAVPAEGPWGRHLAAKSASGHPYYRHARFLTTEFLLRLLTAAGFQPGRSCSTLFQPPDAVVAVEAPRPGLVNQAGFIALLAEKS